MMAKQPARVRVAILFGEDTSPGVALLMRDILQRTNQRLGTERFDIKLVGRAGLRRVTLGPVSVRLESGDRAFDHLLVPALSPGSDPFATRAGEARLITRLHGEGTAIHAACLGSLLVAQTGLLDGRSATTHWNWGQQAAEHYPDVRWDTTRMLCDAVDVVTAGGYLAAVDLTLALVQRVCSRAVAREMGRMVLADSVRQHQSVYATTLVCPRSDDPRMRRLASWLDGHLSSAITVDAMAQVCGLGVRTFHRAFVAAWGVTPKKYLQLKRVEKVRALLRDPQLSVEQAIVQVGVSDVPSFRRIFRRELGMSPAEYRRHLRSA